MNENDFQDKFSTGLDDKESVNTYIKHYKRDSNNILKLEKCKKATILHIIYFLSASGCWFKNN